MKDNKSKYTLLLLLVVGLQISMFSQEANTVKVYRINVINPAFEAEFPTSNQSTLSAGFGIGYGGSYPDLSSSGNGFRYLISPFLDVQHKWYYNLDKRIAKNKSIKNNTGNFVSIRALTRGSTIESNFRRTSDYDFAVGPTWGLQRNYGKFHLLVDIGPIYYFDAKGNGNIFPLMLQINIGFDL